MSKVAVLQFPGINSEYETLRALWDAQIEAEFFRWNQPAADLAAYDGYVIPGGFAYEDRGRSGLIASMDPIMLEISRQADSGKPVLGICNGAQILVETGLIPGGANHELLLCLARNKRVKDGRLLGVGFYNENVNVRCEEPRRCAFTLAYEGGEIEKVPVAHGEGRFTTTIPGLLEKLQENRQIIFRYCTKDGQIDSNFPSNPNGAMDNAAAICNPRGNVLAIMPHPERAPLAPMPKIFTSMRLYMEARAANSAYELEAAAPPLSFHDQKPPLKPYSHQPQTIELYVQLKITDNEAQTLENTLRQHGFDVTLRKWTHYEISHAPNLDQKTLADELIASGELLNLNKESVLPVLDPSAQPSISFLKNQSARYFLVRDFEDSAGVGKTTKLRTLLGDKITQVHQGWFWEVSGLTEGELKKDRRVSDSSQADIEKLLATNIFANHHAQETMEIIPGLLPSASPSPSN